MKTKNRKWLYFGCVMVAGHFVHDEDMRRMYVHEYEFARFDGLLPPMKSSEPYVATVSRLPGVGVSALAFWDYSIDPRPKSNSVFFVNDLDISAEDMLKEAEHRFPEIWERFPTVNLYGG